MVFGKNPRRYNAGAAPEVPPWGWGAWAANRGGAGGVLGFGLGLATQGTTQDARKAAPLLASQRIRNPSAYLVGALPGQSWGFPGRSSGLAWGFALRFFLCGLVVWCLIFFLRPQHLVVHLQSHHKIQRYAAIRAKDLTSYPPAHKMRSHGGSPSGLPDQASQSPTVKDKDVKTRVVTGFARSSEWRSP